MIITIVLQTQNFENCILIIIIPSMIVPICIVIIFTNFVHCVFKNISSVLQLSIFGLIFSIKTILSEFKEIKLDLSGDDMITTYNKVKTQQQPLKTSKQIQ